MGLSLWLSCSPCVLAGASADEPTPAGDAAAEKDHTETSDKKSDASKDDGARRRLMRRFLAGRIERMQDAIAAIDRGDNIDDIRRRFLSESDVAGPRGERPFGRGDRDGRGGPREGGDDAMFGPGGAGGDRDSDKLGPHGHGGPDHPEPREMTDADMETMRAVIAQVTPNLAKRLDTLAEQDPAEAKRRYERMFGRMRPLIDLKEVDPAMFDLKIEEITTARKGWDLARKVVRAEREAAGEGGDAASAEQARADLRANLDKLFDVRIAIRRREHEMSRTMFEEAGHEIDLAAAEKDQRVAAQYDGIIERVRRHKDDGRRPGGPDGPDGGGDEMGGPPGSPFHDKPRGDRPPPPPPPSGERE